ncbi:MAG: HDIG domain-containing protein [Acidobacteriota bacterium]|nr:MAG: HDIG domain-containing protein [Acidobacteriota bacterium]
MQHRRETAWELLTEYTENPNLLKHAIAVEASMRAYAEKFGEDAEKWAVVGLIHDFDYEMYPDEHPVKGARILAERGFPDDVIQAVLSHATFTGVNRDSLMDKALFAVDELCGLITAATLVRPGKRLADLPVKSVKKKMKDKAFARTVNRDDIRLGAEELGVDLSEHIGFVIAAMTRVADELGLSGE